MRLTRFTDYSLRVLIYLACEPGRRATIAASSATMRGIAVETMPSLAPRTAARSQPIRWERWLSAWRMPT